MGTLVRYTRPNYRHLSKTFNELMDEFFAPINARTTDNLTPKVDIRENEQEFEFLLELPGVRKENLQIELEEDVFMFLASVKWRKKQKKLMCTEWNNFMVP